MLHKKEDDKNGESNEVCKMPNYMILDYRPQPQDASCPWCGKSFRYRLIGSSICEVDLMILTFDEGELVDGTGL